MPVRPAFSSSGASALLMDFAQGAFDLLIQRRLWSLCGKDGPLQGLAGVRGVVLGVNNVLVRFDPITVRLQHLRDALEAAWDQAVPRQDEGQLIEVPVIYDTMPGSELEQLARNAGLSVGQAIALHTSVDYWVSCIGWVPGFAFLTGLPPELSAPRKATPPARVPKGSVGIGGSQTGIIPLEVPSGWNLIGKSDLDMFDPTGARPCLLAPGDRVRFIVQGVNA